jgi:hypothetical protein
MVGTGHYDAEPPAKVDPVVRACERATAAIALCAVACTVPAPTPAPPPARAQTVSSSSSPARASHPAPPGPFHLRLRNYDAVNLRFADDGTYRWTLDGCHYEWAGAGTWRASAPGTLELAAPRGRELTWIGDDGQMTLESVRVARNAGGLEVTLAGEGSSQVQQWLRGQVCSVCGAERGGLAYASAPPSPCDAGVHSRPDVTAP